ncbi:MAG: flagellar export chaperone FliS [Anaerolineae bacterium]
MMQTYGRAAAYKERQIMTASPLDLVITTYDVALMGCATEDMQRSLAALSQLRAALNWKAAPEIAPRLQAIYEFCEECIRKRDFEVPSRILRELRDTWVEVRRRVNAEKVAESTSQSAKPVILGASAFSLAG